MTGTPCTVVLVPGLRGDVDDHWQTLLSRRLPGTVTVRSFDRDKLDLDGRVDDLQEAVAGATGPVLLAAHSAGCLVTVHWARRYGGERVVGALLATPPDLGDPLPAPYPSLDELWEAGWLPLPTEPLPFPSILAASSNDPLSEPDRIRALAAAWGSQVVDVGAVGHLNPASGHGAWPGAVRLLDRLQTRLVTT
jgi:hypothetical protein